MKVRSSVIILAGLLALGAAWFLWPRAGRPVASPRPVAAAPLVAGSSPVVAANATNAPSLGANGRLSAATTNRLTFRLANTPKSIAELTGDRHAILLENAFIDTSTTMDLKIPSHLKAAGEPGAYIVQSRGPIDGSFRNAISGAGGQIVSYIPNAAYLVQVSAAGASVLAQNARVQAVLPYEPYYKVQSTLLGLAVNQKPLPAGTYLTLGLFPGSATATLAQLKKLGANVLSQDRSPFGPMVRVDPPADWIALANLPGVQHVEAAYLRKTANDLTRVAVGVSLNTTNGATNNYLGLNGNNVLVEVNDTGIDWTHPDFSMLGVAGSPGPAMPSRISFDVTNSVYDVDGHGTHVAGIIAGNGSQSFDPVNVGGLAQGSVTNADFRGKAPLAKLYSVGFLGANDGGASDSYLQEVPAITNALISNNSWVNSGDNQYDLSAASYDAAVRDALPYVTGPQPVLFVFAAGNGGGGNDDGGGGQSDSIESPGTAKNVITVGALEELRNITNIVTLIDGTSNAIWTAVTGSSFLVPGYSARGNVGVQTEGVYGRFKPDVVAPGTFTISTRSSTWDERAYYNPTNYHDNVVGDFVVSNSLVFGQIIVPQNAVGVIIRVFPNILSPANFPTNFPIYVSASGVPDPTDITSYDIFKGNGIVSIPPDNGGSIATIDDLRNGGIFYTIGDPTNTPINFDVLEEVITTNDFGNELIILSNLNNSISGDPDSNVGKHYYRYESGTSMATPAVSGVLALMQDFFTNTLHTTPSPTLLKAMLINGAQLSGNYQFGVTNSINYEGWGQINLPNSIPGALTNLTTSATNGVPMFFLDQSPTNTLATGDSRTYMVSVPSLAAQSLPLRVTLAWTDPPGNPAAAVKLVNNLELIVTNLSNGRVYYANNFSASGTPPFSTPTSTNAPPAFDLINNVQNIFLSPTLGTNYSVTVLGLAVNVNAVTLEQTNIVQDFALVIASGFSGNSNGVTVTAAAPSLTHATTPDVNYLPATNGIYFNQFAGSSAPLLSTNDIVFGAQPPYGFTPVQQYKTNAVFHIGQTNQWHFYAITNTMAATNSAFTNAAFIVFLPDTAAIPRGGVFAGTDANSTRPESELSMLVSSPLNFPLPGDANAGGLTNLDVTVISNCLFGLKGDASSIGPGGSKFIAYSNSQPNQIYYIGVQCQDQTAAEFAFVPVFSDQPFSTMDKNGNQYIKAFNVPAYIPDGNNRHAGVSYVLGLALNPMEIKRVIVTNTISHQLFGDLFGALSHGGTGVVLNNHDGLGTVFSQLLAYDDSGQGDIPGTIHSDGPGSLTGFRGQDAAGLWVLNEIDDSRGNTGTVENLQIKIEPHRDLSQRPFITVTVPPGGWFYDFLDVTAGYTNLLIVATNLAPTSVPPIRLFVKEGDLPQLTDTNDNVALTNCSLGLYPTGINPGNSISVGPPLAPDRYFVGLYNPDTVSHTVLLGAILSFNSAAVSSLNFGSSGLVPLADDAITIDPQTGDLPAVFVSSTDTIQDFNVGLRVDHPRISDLAITLISPDDTRYLLMENRGADTTNGCGLTVITTNNFGATANGSAQPDTNYLNVGSVSGSLPITYNFYTAPDEMTIYYGTNINPSMVIYDTGVTSNPSGGPGAQNTQPVTFVLNYGPTNGVVSTYITIVMDEFLPSDRADAWTYKAGGVQTNYVYLTFTDNTNLTTTPIKYAPPPFIPQGYFSTNYTLSDFDLATPGDYAAPLTFTDESIWSVLDNQVSVMSDPANAQTGSNFLSLAFGVVSNSFVTVPGAQYTLGYFYRGPGIVSWWRGENTPVDTISGYNLQLENGASYTPAGRVGRAFNLNGTDGYLLVQTTNNSALNVGASGGMTIEGWIKPRTVTTEEVMLEYTRVLGTANGSDTGVGLAIHADLQGGGLLYANLVDTAGNGHIVTSPPNSLTANVWQHIAVTYEQATGTAVYYINGVIVAVQPLGGFPLQTTFTNITLGARTTYGTVRNPAAPYSGLMDELSLYNRALSASEIQGIYSAGFAGKFDPAEYTNSPALSLAEATVMVPGLVTNTILGDNANWQQQSISFVANQTTTPVVISGLEPGMLLDSFTLSGAKTNGLYYQPEQSIIPINNTSGYGFWHLEILDNRTGATNFTPMLVSWNLGITYANTNYTIPLGSLDNGTIETNTAPPGSLTWFEVIVPTNAIAQTNTLLFASLPLNIWFSTTNPPTTNNPFGTEEQMNSQGGFVVLYTNSLPLPMLPGTTNFVGVQNPNNFGATYAISVTFDLLASPGSNTPAPPFASTLPATAVTGTNAQLNGFATPNGTNAGAWFQWGTTTNYGNVTPVVDVGTNFFVVYVTNSITNLFFAEVYHARLVVSNILGTTFGADQQFAPGVPVAWGENAFGQATVPPGMSNVVAVAGGRSNSLALFSDGTVSAWGANNAGQTNVPPGVTNVFAIAAGGDDSLALLGSGLVVEWGDNASGQTNVPVSVTNAVMVAAGWSNGVALLNNGNVVAWGDNSYGQTNVPVTLVSNVVAVAAGGNDVMALLNNGTVVSWGANTGQTFVPANVTNAVAVAEGDGSHSLALNNTGVLAWGTPVSNSIPVPPGLSNVVAIAAGQDDSLVLLNNGQVYAWGQNSSGQTNFPVGLTTAFAVACGAYHDLALAGQPPVMPPFAYSAPATVVTGTNAQINGFATANASAASAWFNWGSSTNYINQTPQLAVNPGYSVDYLTNGIANLIFGQTYHYQLVVSNSAGVTYGFDQMLVAGTTIAWGDNTYNQSTPEAGISNVVAIAAGANHNLEVLSDSSVRAWGNNSFGQSTVPVNLTNVVAVAAGFDDSLALTNLGMVSGWGHNQLGQISVPAVSNLVAVAARSSASMALRNNGLVVAWGDNTYGQITIPPGLTNVVSIAEGGTHSLALLNDGTVTAWGLKNFGQATVPPGLSHVVAVAAGDQHSLALQSNGVVVAWGNDALGQTDVPPGLSNVVAIAAGAYHNLALRNDGTVVAWGYNASSQTNVPAGLSNAVAVSAGQSHSLVLASPFDNNLNLFPYPTNGLPVTNVVGPGSINWFIIQVPTNAVAATNALLFATLPLNLWWSTNAPPSITHPNDHELLSNQTNGSVVLYINNPPPMIIPGGIYYLGVQNTNSVPVTNAIQVTFDIPIVAPILPFDFTFELIQAGDTSVVTNTASDIYPGDFLSYTLTNQVFFTFPTRPGGSTNLLDGPVINPTNGIITWATSTNDSFAITLATTVVTDTNTALSSTNFIIYVVFPEFFIDIPNTNTLNSNSISWFLIQVPTNAIAATNALLSATAPLNLWYSTNLPPSIINPGDVELLTNSVNGTNVISLSNSVPLLLPGRFYFLGVENTNSFIVTNVLKVSFRYRLVPPVLPFIPTQVIAGGDTLIVTNTAKDTNAGAVLVYYLTNSPAGASIDTNGIINWPTTTNMAPTNATITTIVTDPNTGLSATNSFLVFVLPALTGGEPNTNVVGTNGINWFLIKVPNNALAATNALLFASLPVNLWYSTNAPPSITNALGGDFEMLTNATNGIDVITPGTVPRLVPGSVYYLGVQNLNTVPVTNAVEVTFKLAPLQAFSIFSIVQTTNSLGTNGYLLTWYAPTNLQFHVQWTQLLLPITWNNFKGVVSFLSPNSPTNGLFQYFDDGSQTGGFDPTRFYRLQLLNSPTNTAPEFIVQPANRTGSPSVTVVVTNTARDYDVPPQTLVYSAFGSLPGTNVVTIGPLTGIINWTPDASQAGLTNHITTIVSDNGVPLKSANNTFDVYVNPVPPAPSVVVSASGVDLQWTGPTNEQFGIRWATNLVSPVNWFVLPPPPITSTNGVFKFTDTNTSSVMKFYQLILLP